VIVEIAEATGAPGERSERGGVAVDVAASASGTNTASANEASRRKGVNRFMARANATRLHHKEKVRGRPQRKFPRRRRPVRNLQQFPAHHVVPRPT
jgi:hypothetical protein